MLLRGDTGNGKMSLKPFTDKAVIERRSNFENLRAVCGHIRYIYNKPEGRGLDFRWGRWDFALTSSFRPHCGPGVDSTEMSARGIF